MDKIKEIVGNFRYRKRILASVDGFIVFTAGLIANLLFSNTERMNLSFVLLLCVASCFGGLLLFGAYNKLWRYFNRYDYLTCVEGVGVGIAIAYIFVYVFVGSILLPFVFCHAVISVFGVCMFRYMFKNVFVSLINCGKVEASRKRTMIIGCGNACILLLNEIRNCQEEVKVGRTTSSACNIDPVCIVDDDRTKIGRIVNGVLVAGGTSDIPKLVLAERVEQIIFAIPSCPVGDRQVILDICAKTGLPVKVLPFVGSLLESEGAKPVGYIQQIRDIKVEDLLGRDPIRFDNADIRAFIEGKTCMVTGGGGSIGSELVRQIAKYNPKQVVIVDIYENNAYEIQQELLMEYGHNLDFVALIASVRDYFRMNQIFTKYKPDVVFHAAAHKHVPLMEYSPMEAIKNNVIGTFNMGTLSMLHNVKKFVMISTDKAVNPTNVMGASKRCCEMVVQFLSQQKDSKTEFVTTRFGNVLGSNGSVIPLFKKQIEQGKPVTVTHPDIIRYFMTIPEAVSLVMEAASIAHGGEIFVLDMGQPVKIVTLAENLIRMYGKVPYKDVEIKFTGLRPGEKIKEELLMNEEGLQKTRNKLIFIGKQIEIDTDRFINELWSLKNAAAENNEELAVRALHEIVPTFTTPEEFNRTILEKAV